MKNKAKLSFLLIILILAAGCKSKPPVTESTVSSVEVLDIFAGVADLFVLRKDGTLWGVGYNHAGQLGLGEIAQREIAQGSGARNPHIACINDETGKPFSGVKAVAVGENHAVILREDGSLWGAGDSSNGELGLEGGRLAIFTRLKATDTPISGAKALAVGNNSTFYIDSGGSLWAAGHNYYGELGLGNQDAQSSFKKVESAGQSVKALAAGIRHTALLKEDGTLWTAGYNYNGQLGLGDAEDRNSFTEVKSAGSGITAVAAGNYHTVILKSDGSVWAAGSNFWGQIGFPDSDDRQAFTRVTDENGNTLTDVREIAARGDITVLLKADGSLLLAGNYTDPQAMYDQASEEKVSGPKEEPQNNQDAKSTFVPLLPDKGAAIKFGSVKKIILGYNSIYVIDSDGRLWAAGSNRYGQLNLDFDTEASSVLKYIGQ